LREINCSDGLYGWTSFPSTPDLTNIDPQNPQNQFWYSFNVGDYNGDGLSDIIQLHYLGNDVQQVEYDIYYNNGSGFQHKGGSFDKIGGLNAMGGTYYRVGQYNNIDFNGDGKADIYFPQGVNKDKIYYADIDNENSVMVNIANGFNSKTSFEYEPLTNTNIYTKYNDAFSTSNGKLYDIQAPLYVVSEVNGDNGIGNLFSATYKYEGARVHRLGKGFLGFASVIKNNEIFGYDDVTHLETISNFAIQEPLLYDNPHYNMIPASTISRIKTYVGGDYIYEPLSESSFSYSYNDEYESSDLVFMPYLEQSIAIDNQKNDLTITTDYIVDDKGNITSESIDFDGEGTKTTTATYTSNGSWCNYLPDFVTVTQINGQKDPFVNSTDFVYGPEGLLVQKISFANLQDKLSEFYTYDGFGNVSSITNKPLPSSVPRSIYFEYDSKGRFVIKKTNILNHESFFTYCHKTGNILVTTDASGLVTKHFYDAFGRNTSTVFPDGNKSDFSIHWDANNPNGNILYYTQSVADGLPEAKTFYDLIGRERLTTIEDMAGNSVETETEYNSNGQVDNISESYFSNSDPTQWTYYHYFANGSLDKVDFPNTNFIEYTYSGLSTSVYNSGTNITTSKTVNAFGLTETATDPGGTIMYDYYSSGQPEKITAPDGSEFSMVYDNYGRQAGLTDPDAGTTTYSYNDYGELVQQEDAKANIFYMDYDDFGRLEVKWDNGGTQVFYSYVDNGNGLGQIGSISNNHGIEYNYGYDEFNRVKTKTEIVDGLGYETKFTYDNYGNTETVTYPSGFSIQNTYNKGYLSEVYREDNHTLLYSNPEYNVRGQLTAYDLGNNLHTHKGFEDDTGLPNAITTTNVQNLTYGFDASTGNLNWRKDNIFTLQETFTYTDALKNRLTSWQVGTQTNTAAYMLNGNIDSKSDMGAYHYEYNVVGGSGGPHSVTKISDPVNLPAEADQLIHYNVFNKVDHIEHQNLGDDYYISYGPGQARKKTVLKHNGTTLKTKYYIGVYEKEIDESGNITETHYIPGGDGLLALYIIKNGNGQMYYAHKDHLGSLYALTDENGNIASYNGQEQRFSFDPWGRRRNPTDWTFNNVPNPGNYLTDRGFTGHEHLDLFGLVNMNGRMYDPLLGRMLSPDNYVQSPTNSQNFNRYSYVMNNPLVYTDPSGELIPIWIIPNISINSNGNVTFSITIGVGMPGIAFAGVTLGGSTDGSYFASLGGNLGLLNASIGWNSTVGWNGSLGLGIPKTGMPIGSSNFAVSSNIANIGISYSQYGGLNANALGFNYSFDNSNVTFNPSVGISYIHNAGFMGKKHYIYKNYPEAMNKTPLKNTRIRTKKNLKNNDKKAYGVTIGYEFENTTTGRTYVKVTMTLDRTMVMNEYLGKSLEFANTIYHEGTHANDYVSGFAENIYSRMSQSRAYSYLEVRAYETQLKYASFTGNDNIIYMNNLNNFLFGN
ncbi:MAG: hypothetical protein GXO89_15635, partial [Chlorobi bacterium]|nr:hypothetical protein [Chlorobiota bacterium]